MRYYYLSVKEMIMKIYKAISNINIEIVRVQTNIIWHIEAYIAVKGDYIELYLL